MGTWRALTTFTVLVAIGCERPPASPTDAATGLLCPELAGSSDPLELPYADAPPLDARIRAFVSAARGLNDVTIEVEQRAVDACRRMARDLGVEDAPSGAPLDVQCAPLRASIARLAKEGVEVRISIAPPRCEPDASRKARCDAVSGPAGGSPDTQTLCAAQSEMYARCSMPSVSFAGSSNVDLVVRLGRTLEENLPTLLYAELALAKRLSGHVQAIVATSPRVAAEIKDAGPHGIACVALATGVTAKSADRLQRFLTVSASTIGGLAPEIREGGDAARREPR